MHLVSLVSLDKFYRPDYARKNIVFKNIYIQSLMPHGSVLTEFAVDISRFGT